MGIRKYEEVKGYWVYSIQIKSNGKYYIGISKCKECWQRWRKSMYKDSSLAPYLNEWESMVKTVLIDGLNTKEEALQFEDALIQSLKMNNLCINERRSGLITDDINTYHRKYRENNSEYREYQKQYQKRYKRKKLEQTSLQ